MSLGSELRSLAAVISRGDASDFRTVARLVEAIADIVEPTPLLVSGNLTITAANAGTYNGRTLNFSTAATVTLSAGLPPGFGFAFSPPASGNASIAASSVTLNGAGTTITRAAASNVLCALCAIGTNAYAVSGT